MSEVNERLRSLPTAGLGTTETRKFVAKTPERAAEKPQKPSEKRAPDGK